MAMRTSLKYKHVTPKGRQITSLQGPNVVDGKAGRPTAYCSMTAVCFIYRSMLLGFRKSPVQQFRLSVHAIWFLR